MPSFAATLNFAATDFANLPPEAQLAEGRVSNALGVIRDYLANADEATLGYLKMTDKQRHEIIDPAYHLYYNAGNAGNTLIIQKHRGEYEVFYTEAAAMLRPEILVKLAAHEIGHPVTEDDSATGQLATLCRGASLGLGIILPIAGATYGWNQPEISTVSGGILGYLGHKATQAALLYPMRREEKAANRFSDRILPEVSFRSVYSNYEKLFPDDFNWVSRRPFQRGVSVFKQHPSDFTLMRESSENCKKFLAEKKRLGIPSLIAS